MLPIQAGLYRTQAIQITIGELGWGRDYSLKTKILCLAVDPWLILCLLHISKK